MNRLFYACDGLLLRDLHSKVMQIVRISSEFSTQSFHTIRLIV